MACPYTSSFQDTCLAGKSCSPLFLDYQTAFYLALLNSRSREQPTLLSNIYSYSMDFGLFLDFKSVTRNSDSQVEVSKNGLHMSDANVKPVVTPSQMTASGTCMCDKYLSIEWCTWVDIRLTRTSCSIWFAILNNQIFWYLSIDVHMNVITFTILFFY